LLTQLSPASLPAPQQNIFAGSPGCCSCCEARAWCMCSQCFDSARAVSPWAGHVMHALMHIFAGACVHMRHSRPRFGSALQARSWCRKCGNTPNTQAPLTARATHAMHKVQHMTRAAHGERTGSWLPLPALTLSERSMCRGLEERCEQGRAAHRPASVASNSCVCVGRRSSGKENWMMLSLSALCMAPNSLPSGASRATSARVSASAAP